MFTHSLDIDYESLWIFKKCTAEPLSILVTDTSLASDNPSCFIKNLLKRM